MQVQPQPLQPITVETLPPMPQPDVCTQTAEARVGFAIFFGVHSFGTRCGLVGTDACDFIGAQSGVALPLLWCCFIAALIGLCGMHIIDPGTIPRCVETCFPLSAEVEARIRGMGTMSELQNIAAEDGQGSFCVRCMV